MVALHLQPQPHLELQLQLQRRGRLIPLRKCEANNPLTAGSRRQATTTITSDLLRFVDGGQQGASGTVFKLTEIPDTKTGQIFFKGVAVTQVGVTFTQADIRPRFVNFPSNNQVLSVRLILVLKLTKGQPSSPASVLA